MDFFIGKRKVGANCPLVVIAEPQILLKKIELAFNSNFEPISLFGSGKSDILFMEVLNNPYFWNISKQKQFKVL
jgi:hypothetical protein